MSSSWGIELNGEKQDLHVWQAFLRSPFDPFIEEVEDASGNYLALRSSAFDGMKSAKDVNERAKELFATLNVTIAAHASADLVRNGAVVEFVPDGQPKRIHFLEAKSIILQTRVGMAELTIRNAAGEVIQSPVVESAAQRWLRAATIEPEIGCALRYLAGKPTWFELYKAYEALRNMPNGGIANSEVKRFTQTANAGERHHSNNKIKPHKKPMELWKARALIMQWVNAAIEDVLGRSP